MVKFDDNIIPDLSKLLGVIINSHSSQFLSQGYSRGVFKVDCQTDQGAKTVVVKKVESRLDWEIYRNLLKPYDLRSPEMLGPLEVNGQNYIVIEWIPNKVKENHDRFIKAVDYLIEKDTKLFKD